MNIFFNDDIYKEPVQELVDKLDSTADNINSWFQTNGGSGICGCTIANKIIT